MAARRTWLWITCGTGVALLLALVAAAGACIYFVSRHVQSEATSSAEALDAFDRVTASFEGRRPLYELDAQERPHLTTELSTLPAASTPPRTLMVQAWNPDDQRLVRISLPFWLLRFGPDHLRVSHQDRGFDLTQLQLNIDELERIGPALVVDYRNQDGVRILLWTR
jgi:hypothetical protein